MFDAWCLVPVIWVPGACLVPGALVLVALVPELGARYLVPVACCRVPGPWCLVVAPRAWWLVTFFAPGLWCLPGA